MMNRADSIPRRSIALVVVCFVHAVLGWALLALGSERVPSRDQAGPDEGVRLVAVRLVAPMLDAGIAPQAGPTAPTAPASQPLRPPTPAARPPAVTDIDHHARASNPAGGRADAPSDAGAPLVQAEAPSPAEVPPQHPAPATQAPSALAALADATPGRGESPPLVMAQADRRQCPPAPHPAALRERGIEGAVLLRVKVDVQGRPADVQLIAPSGWRLFDEAALQQVRSCRFIPAMQGGQAIDSWVEFPVRFALAG
jgi:protein TonB